MNLENLKSLAFRSLSDDDSTSEKLMLELLEGNPEVIERITREVTYSVSSFGDDAKADIVQEVLVKLLTVAKGGGSIPDPPMPYISRMARNLAITNIRKRDRAGKLSQKLRKDRPISYHPLWEQGMIEQQINALLARIDANLRSVIEERVFEGLTHEEIGNNRGISHHAARRLWYKARLLLTDLLINP